MVVPSINSSAASDPSAADPTHATTTNDKPSVERISTKYNLVQFHAARSWWRRSTVVVRCRSCSRDTIHTFERWCDSKKKMMMSTMRREILQSRDRTGREETRIHRPFAQHDSPHTTTRTSVSMNGG